MICLNVIVYLRMNELNMESPREKISGSNVQARIKLNINFTFSERKLEGVCKAYKININVKIVIKRKKNITHAMIYS